MKLWSILQVLTISSTLTLLTACQMAPPMDFGTAHAASHPTVPIVQPGTGRYTSSIPGQLGEKFAEVHITESGGRYTLEFSFGYLDGHGAAPDGTGTGTLDANGVLSFQFEDSFSNRGRGTFRTDHNGHWLLIQIDQVEEPRCLAFYGKIRMARQGKNPQE
jgi:hypothetical protein